MNLMLENSQNKKKQNFQISFYENVPINEEQKIKISNFVQEYIKAVFDFIKDKYGIDLSLNFFEIKLYYAEGGSAGSYELNKTLKNLTGNLDVIYINLWSENKEGLDKEAIFSTLFHEIIHSFQQNRLKYYNFDKRSEIERSLFLDDEIGNIIWNTTWIVEGTAELAVYQFINDGKNKQKIEKLGLNKEKILEESKKSYEEYKNLIEFLSMKLGIKTEEFVEKYLDGQVYFLVYRLADVYNVGTEEFLNYLKDPAELICFLSFREDLEQLEKITIAGGYLRYLIENIKGFRNVEKELRIEDETELLENIKNFYRILKEAAKEDKEFYTKEEWKFEIDCLTVLIANSLKITDVLAMIEIRAYALSLICEGQEAENIINPQFYTLKADESYFPIYLRPKKIDKYKKEINQLLIE